MKPYQITFLPKIVRLECETIFDVPVAKVWETLVDLDGWKRWSSSLYLKRPLGRRPSLGDKLFLSAHHSLWFNPIDPFSINVKICDLIPERSLVWEGRPMGTYGKHGFNLEDLGSRCRVMQWEEGHGPMARLGAHLGVFDSIGRIHLQTFKDLSKHLAV